MITKPKLDIVTLCGSVRKDSFNAALKDYLGTDEMMAAVAEYGYDKDTLPGDKTTEWVCGNR